MRRYAVLAAVLVIVWAAHTRAQAEPAADSQIGPPPTSPVIMEAMAGDRALFYQLVIDKKLLSIPALGFFGVLNTQPEWGEEGWVPWVVEPQDTMIQGNLTYELVPGFDLALGFITDPIRGLHGTAALKYSYVTRDWLFMVSPRVDLQADPGLEGIVMVEYKPAIYGDDWRLYSRAQALYNHDTGYAFDDGDQGHGRSYVYLRLGLTYKDITAGFAANLDWYGPDAISDSNIGAFLQLALF